MLRCLSALIVCLSVLLTTAAGYGSSFNGSAEYQRDDLGYYYVMTGGKVTGVNGATAGTLSFVTDDPAWGYPTEVWNKDTWFTQTAGLALTLKNNAAIVYDNNGIEDGSHDGFYEVPPMGTNAATPGLYRGYSMSNNWDWIYAGYFKLDQATTITELIGYFDENAGFDRNSPFITYNLNIFSKVDGDHLPTNTGGFDGDVFSSDNVAGTIAVSDTGVNRVFQDGATDPIFRLSYTLDMPLVLEAGEYWFSHDAQIIPTPAAAVVGLGMFGLLAVRRPRKD